MGLISLGISNAHKLYNDTIPGNNISLSTFTKKCVEELLMEIEKREPTTTPLQNSSSSFNSPSFSSTTASTSSGTLCAWNCRKNTLERKRSRLEYTSDHIPIRSSYSNNSKRCKVCGVSRPSTLCAKCGVYVCIQSLGTSKVVDMEDSCWYKLHNSEKL